MSIQTIKHMGFRSALAVAVASAALAGCGGGSSGSSAGGGTIKLDGAAGGNAAGAYGGTGGYVQVDNYNGQGKIQLVGTGRANTAFPVRSVPNPEMGVQPLVISANTTIAVAASKPATGTPYILASDSNIYVSSGAGALGSETAVTGLKVNAGVTLKLEPNYDWDGGVTGYDAAYIWVDRSIENRGTITSLDAPTATTPTRGDLDVEAGDTFVNIGTINADGTTTAPNAGYIYLYGYYAALNSGTITAQGADTTSGNAGNGDSIELNGGFYTQNTGPVKGSGGKATAGNGGNGAYIALYSDDGALMNSGALTANGGNGTTAGGAGDAIRLYTTQSGSSNWPGTPQPMYNSGPITANGGDASAGNAGDAAYIDLKGYPAMRNSGAITAHGGTSTFAGGNGGSAQYVYAEAKTAYGVWWSSYTIPVQDAVFSGSVDLAGGAGGSTGTGDGGDGGYLQVYADEDQGNMATGDADIMLLGYASIAASGGKGFSGGGDAGYVDLYTYDSDAPSGTLPGGDITLATNMTANGGDATGATGGPLWGGSGGYVDVYPDDNMSYGAMPQYSAVGKVSGTYNLNGGKGYAQLNTSNSRGGYIDIESSDDASFSGTVIANGGDDLVNDNTGTDGRGGYSDYLEVFSIAGSATLRGTVQMNAGAGEYQGGNGAWIGVVGATSAVRAANISVKGGDADATLMAGSMGGDGGDIEVHSSTGTGSSTGASVISGGTGATKGAEGYNWALITCTGAGC